MNRSQETPAETLPSATLPAAVLSGVHKQFGDVHAVADVDLTLEDGELLVLVGPSGCGKSTLLRSIAGLEQIDRGEIVLGDRVVDDGSTALPPERRRIGLVFQEHALFPHLDVEHNVSFGLSHRGGSEAQRRTAEVLELVGLGAYGSRYPHELSGGERQRVALARALAPEPDVLLLDEPFASLDPNLRATLRRDVVDILRLHDTSAIFVTHDQAEAVAIGDRVAVMRSGALLQVGTPWEVFHRPVSTFVASFMGEADFVAIEGSSTELGPAVIEDRDASFCVGMVRPDDVTFIPNPDGDATVIDAEFRGGQICYTLRLASGVTVRSARSHELHVAVGTPVRVGLEEGHRPVAVPVEPVT